MQACSKFTKEVYRLLQELALFVSVIFNGNYFETSAFLEDDDGLVREAAVFMAIEFEVVPIFRYVHVDFEEAAYLFGLRHGGVLELQLLDGFVPPQKSLAERRENQVFARRPFHSTQHIVFQELLFPYAHQLGPSN